MLLQDTAQAKEMIVAASCQLIGNTFAGRWQLTQPAAQQEAAEVTIAAPTTRRMPTNVRTVRLASVNPSVCVCVSACVCVCQCVKLFKQLSDSINNKNTKKKVAEKDGESVIQPNPSQLVAVSTEPVAHCQGNGKGKGLTSKTNANCKYLFNTFVAHIQWQ